MARRGSRSLTLAIVAAMVMSAPAAATTGWLDPTFSDDGHVRLDPPVGSEPIRPRSLIVRDGPTGRVFLGRGAFVFEGSTFDVLALTPRGTVDGSFNGGDWTNRIGGTDHIRPIGVFPMADGGVLAAGWRSVGSDLQVIRFGPGGGEADSFFGTTGDDEVAASMVRLPGGSLRTCTWTTPIVTHLIGLTATLDVDGAVWRRELDIGGCHQIVADSASHLYLADDRTVDGTNATRRFIELVRTSNSGRTDTAWADAGRARVERGGLHVGLPFDPVSGAFGYSTGNPAVFPLPDGSLLIAARVARVEPAGPWRAAVVKVTPDGSLDPSFGNGGIKAMGPVDGQSRVLAMTVDSRGRAIVSMVYNHDDGRTRAYLARLTAAGTFDTAFGRNGLIPQTHGARSLDIDADGRILTMASDGQSIVVARRTN